MIPEPYYTLIRTSKGNDSAIVVVNSALRTFRDRQAFPWHLKISIDCKRLGANGMPTDEEGEILKRLEDAITSLIEITKNAIFLARITCQGERVLLYRVHEPGVANDALKQLVSEASQLREWNYRMDHDADWELAQPELHLLEQDPRFS